MSMILYLRRASQLELEALKAPASPLMPAAEAKAKPSFFARLFGSPEPLEPISAEAGDPIHDFFFANGSSGDVVDFDRAWDALNMMLTGEAFGNEGPFAIFYFKGEEIGPDGGYGPARYIPKEKMAEFAAALKDLTDDELAARFDPAGFEAAQLYSSYLFSEDGVEVDYVMQGLPDLRKFADNCVQTNSGALVAIY